jgi:hypothetical protein
MGFGGQVWRLVGVDGEHLADLAVTDGDFPWLNAELRATPAFEAVRPLFVEELRQTTAEDIPASEAAYDRIRAAVHLIDPDGVRVPEFLLHIDGNDAWWRWSDEAFDEED